MNFRKITYLRSYSPAFQLLNLCFLMLVCLFLSLFLGSLIGMAFFGLDFFEQLQQSGRMGGSDSIGILKYLQLVNGLGLFVFPALLFQYLFSSKQEDTMMVYRWPKGWMLMLAAVIIFSAMPVLNQIIDWNEGMQLPEFLGGLEEWIRHREDSAADLTARFMSVHTPMGLLINLFLIAVIPAIGEEFIFRGLVLNLMGKWFRNMHWAVLVSAVIFSAFHFQFYGFVPRMLLGIYLGYLLVWSGSVWVPVFAHFVNNATSVIVTYLAQQPGSQLSEFGVSNNPYILTGSLLISGGLMYLIYCISRRHSTCKKVRG